jgi:hypothetical protein
MEPRTIVNIPETGMVQRDKQSYDALKYFGMREKLDPQIRIQDASWSIGEARFDDRKRVDGVVRRIKKKNS